MTGLLQRPRRHAPAPDVAPNGRVPAAQPVSRTLANAGRVVLWIVLAWIAVAGLIGYVTLVRGNHGAASTSAGRTVFPGDDVKAFAASFATQLLTCTSAGADQRARALAAMAARDVDADQILNFAGGCSQHVDGVWSSRARRLDASHALVTVAAAVQAKDVAPATRYLTVPIARDTDGGLSVYDLPSPAAPPARGSGQGIPTGPVADSEAGGIGALLDRFLPEQYFAGGPVASQYLVPGARVVALGQRYTGTQVTGLDLAASSGRTRTVLATVQARDVASDATQTMRLRITVEYRDQHWLIKSIG